MVSDKAEKCPKCGHLIMKVTTTYQNDRDNVVANEPLSPEEDGHSNSKKYLLIGLLVAAIVGGVLWWFSQSDDEQDILQFVEQFAKAIETNDRQTICKFYPNADKAESLHITYHKDSVVIKHSENNDTIDVKLSFSQSIRLVKDNKKQMCVTSSKGLFVFPTEEMDFAKKTGVWNPSIDDVMLTQRMSETNDMRQWLIQRNVKNIAKNVRVVGDAKVLESHEGAYTMDIYCTLGYTVQNNTNIKIDGSDYRIYFNGDIRGVKYKESEQGKDIPPHSSVVYERFYEFHDLPGKTYTNFIISQEELFKKYYEFNGKEYDEWKQTQHGK